MKEPFFIGWSPQVAPALARFLLGAVIAVPLGLGVLGVLLGTARQDPAGPGFAVSGTAQPPLPEPVEEITGLLTARPYPLLHLAQGRALLLAGDGKRGIPDEVARLDGQRVSASGFLLARGDIAMLVLGAPLAAVEGAAPRPVAQPLGRWRVTGEICDGKCAAGGMRPGIGIAHRACAVLCLDGEIPAVFVPTSPLAGHAYLLLASPEGGPMPAALRPLIGSRVTLEGQVERLGGLLVFRAEPPA